MQRLHSCRTSRGFTIRSNGELTAKATAEAQAEYAKKVTELLKPDGVRRLKQAVLQAGGTLSHHHGVGLNRSRFVREALGPAFDVLVDLKAALDPNGVLNPGKLGLPSPFGEVGAW